MWKEFVNYVVHTSKHQDVLKYVVLPIILVVILVSVLQRFGFIPKTPTGRWEPPKIRQNEEGDYEVIPPEYPKYENNGYSSNGKPSYQPTIDEADASFDI